MTTRCWPLCPHCFINEHPRIALTITVIAILVGLIVLTKEN